MKKIKMKELKIGWKSFRVKKETYDVLFKMKNDMQLNNGDEVIRWMINEIHRLQGWNLNVPHNEMPVLKTEEKLQPKPEVIEETIRKRKEYDVRREIDRLLEERK